MKSKIAVIIASMRDSRNADKIVEWFKTETEQYEGKLDFTFIDLKERDIPRFKAANIPAQRAYEDDFTKAWSKEIEQYDGFVVITPEYNYSYPSSLKDAFDHLFHELTYKPITFIGYGTDGGVRAIEHFRNVIIQLAMVSTRRQTTIPLWEVIEEDVATIGKRFHGGVQEQLRQLDWWAETLTKARAEREPVL